MIGVDTNVLLRLFVNDNELQHKLALEFFRERNSRSPAFISSVVFAELIWALSKRYGYSQDQILDLVTQLINSTDFVIEQAEVISRVVDHCRSANSSLTDTLVSHLAATRGCEKTMTFDRDAAKRVPGMELLK